MDGLTETGEHLVASTDAIQQAFERALPELTVLAFRVAYGVLRQHHAAEDVAQETLLRAHRRLHSLRDEERLRGWLVRIAWRLALDRQRADRRRESREQIASAPRHGENPLNGDEFRVQLVQALDRLPERLRVVLVLAAIQGHELREAASLLGIPEGTAKTRLREARLRLAEMLR